MASRVRLLGLLREAVIRRLNEDGAAVAPEQSTTYAPSEQSGESEATAQAHHLGLVSKGWGRWADSKTGEVVAKTVKGQLVKIEPGQSHEVESDHEFVNNRHGGALQDPEMATQNRNRWIDTFSHPSVGRKLGGGLSPDQAAAEFDRAYPELHPSKMQSVEMPSAYDKAAQKVAGHRQHHPLRDPYFPQDYDARRYK